MDKTNPLVQKFYIRRKQVRILRDANPRLMNRINAYFRLLNGKQYDEHGNTDSNLIGTYFIKIGDYLAGSNKPLAWLFIKQKFDESLLTYPPALQKMILDWLIAVCDLRDNYDQHYSD